MLFKSEAIVHPDAVASHISPQECQISYNPLQMALLWNTLATREVNLLQQALSKRHTLPLVDSPMLKREVCGGDFAGTLDRRMNYGMDWGFPKDVRLVVQVEAVKQ